MSLTRYIIALGILASSALGRDMTACMQGVRLALSPFYFTGGNVFDFYESLCANPLRTTSFYASGKIHCSAEEVVAGSALLEYSCLALAGIPAVPYSAVQSNLTDEYINSLPTLTPEDINVKLILTEVYKLDEELFELGVKTYTVPTHQFVLHKRYGWAVYGFWGGLLLIGMASRFISLISNKRIKHQATDIEGESANSRANIVMSSLTSPFKAIHHWTRANLIVPAAFGSHHQRLYYWCAIPTRIETIIIAAFWILNFILCCVSYEITPKLINWTTALQHWRFISDRTGIISYANLPLLWLFAGRNNIFLWATGWSYSSFSVYHRHIARIATIQAIIHSIGWSVIQARIDLLRYSWTQNYWYMGGIATITMSLLLVLSSVWLRWRHYEIFLIIHIVFAVLTLVGLFYHTAIFTNREYDGYLWPCVAIWVFDRSVRFVRLAYCNYRVQFSGAPMSTVSSGTYDKDSDLLRIVVIPGSRMIRPGPGQHYFIYQYNKLRFWENHPFTLAAWYRSGEDNIIQTPALPNHNTTAETNNDAKIQPNAEIMPSEPTSGSQTPVSVVPLSIEDSDEKDAVIPAGQHKLVFLMRPFNGWTRRLRDECILAGPKGVTDLKLLLEGPYGEHSPLSSFENLIFIVGGSGIAGAIPYLQEYARLTTTASKKSDSGFRSTRTRDITVIWSAKQSSMIRNVTARELRPFLHRDDIHFKFYATRDKKTDAVAVSEKSPSRDIEIAQHRPNVQEAVTNIVDQINSAGSKGGRIAVYTCGPAAMADEARVAAHKNLKAGKQGLEYIEEAFGW